MGDQDELETFAGLCIHELFERQASRSPESTAVVDGSLEVTYAELEARANQLANHLRSLGVEPETRVGLCLDRSADMVAGALGILKAGGAYVPIDPAYPRRRQEMTLADSEISLVVTRQDVWEPLGLGGVRPVRLNEEVAAEPDTPPRVTVDERNLAYLIYTSGSTGRAKGVAIEHLSAVSFLEWARNQFGPEELSAVLAPTSLCFDLSIFELFAPLSTGGRIVLARDALQLRELPAAGEVTLVNTVPSAMAELLRSGGLPPSVRTVNLAGEPLRARLVQQVYERSLAQRVYNFYGPSEDTTYSTFSVILRGDERPPRIGRPLPGTQTYLVDSALQLVPEGEAGELYLGGGGLTRGYLNRPELTAERYVPDPFSGQPGARLYRTGDLVRWSPDGELDFLGRIDHQVKIRGFRIELGEIETVLAAHPGIEDAAVMARETAGGDRRLVAYAEPVAGVSVTAADLRESLTERLPGHMVPSVFVLLAALPRLPNGKIDRGGLPEPPSSREGVSAPFEAPRTLLEERIAALWEDLTGASPVGISDDFLELGGHSLLAAQTAARLREALGVDLPAHVCLQAGTVAVLAAEVERRLAAGVQSGPPLVPVPREGKLPLSFAQQRLWLVHRLDPDSPVYNVPEAVRLRGPLDAEALERALNRIVERHEALRTTFTVSGEGAPFQKIAERLEVPWTRLDLSGLPPGEQEKKALAAVREAALRPFDLEAGPVLRALLVRLAADDHLLLLAVHHVAADGWSLDVLFRELGAGPQVSPLPVQYADFAVWQRERLTGPGLREAVEDWSRRLAGVPPLDLPTDRARPAVQSHRGATHRLAVPAETVEALRRLGRQEEATPFMALLAGWQALLGRYARQDDFAVGSPVAGRTHRELEDLIGFFVNLLPLRADLAGEPSGRVLVGRVRTTALAAYAGQEVPFDRLVDELRVERDPSRSPVFQTVLALEETSVARRGLPGLDVTRVDFETGTAKFDLTLFLEPEADGLRAAIEYRTDLFEASTVHRMAARFGRLLAGLAAEPDRPVADLSLLDEAEQYQLLHELNPASPEGGDARPVHLRVAAVAATAPERLAVGGHAPVSYGELDRRANQVAQRLVRLGIGPETVVGVLTGRSADMAVAGLAVLKAGGAYLPLDPDLPAERLRTMLGDSGAAVLVTHGPLLGKVPPDAPPVLSLDDPSLAGEPVDAPRVAVGPEDLAYVIYTSGSTGEPKGVAVPHRGLSNLVSWHQRIYEVSPEDRASSVAGLSFDASVWEIWPYLAAGASLHPAPEEVRLAPARLLEWLAAERVTLAFLPTPLAERALAEELPEGLALRVLLTGGDKLGRRGPAGLPFSLVNHYGPTENSVVATSASVPADDGAGLPPPIGRPIDNVQAYLLDSALRPVPFGMPGEAFLAGEGLARGYLGRPDATAERFVPDPFGGPGGRLYRTGDLARYRADGELQFLGRADHQIKIRGLRIEPGEVEATLARYPGARQAVVGTVPDAAGQPRLVAWLVASGEGFSIDGLRAWLGERLPAPMIPSAFVRMDALPLTPNGKLDRRALPVPTQEEAEAGPAEAPRGEIEELIAGLWRQLLGRPAVGPHDDFFRLGGHSLLAAQAVSRIGAAFGVDLPLRDLFENPTVAGMAGRVAAARERIGDSGGRQLPPLEAAGRPEPIPLSLAQEGLWFLHQLDPESGSYNIPSVFRLRGGLDVPALASALEDVVRRHEALRTAFPEGEDGRPVQSIAPSLPVPLPVIDLVSLPATRWIADEVERPFDLAQGPLLRALLLRADEREHVLVLTVHHMVADGWSMGVLHREIGACYEARLRGAAPALEPLRLQYADFAVWQRRCAEEGWLAPQLAFWRERLTGAGGPLELTGGPRPAALDRRGATLRTALGAGLTASLRELAGREGATPLMVMRAAFEALLFRYSGRERFVVGSPVAGRGRPELEELIGFFVNVLPVPADLSGYPGFRGLLARVREAALAAYGHPDVPFERLVEELRPARENGRNPFFEILFAGNPPVPAPAMPGLDAARVDADTGTTKFDLTLFVEDDLGLALEYDAGRFEAATAQRLLGHLRSLLASAVVDAARAVSELPMLSEAEGRHLLEGWGRAVSHAPLDRTIPELFEQCCAARPEAVALIAGDETLTYGELNRRANRLAHHLRRLGAGTDLPVGIVAERSLDMVAGLLGILKAGGVYVPLDPSHPVERLAAMAADAGLSLVVGPRRRLADLPAGMRTVSYEGALVVGDEANPAPSAFPDSLAYILFTSGSTGRPKGVAVPHRGVVRLVRGADFASFSADQVFFQYAPVAFDLSTLEIWGPLLNGGRLAVPPPGNLSLEELGAQLRRHGVTFLWLTAGLFHLMVDEQLDSLRSVRQLIAGGDVLSVPHVERALAALIAEGGAVINGYGPTENTTFTTCHPMRDSVELAATVPIGRPIRGTNVAVAGAALELLPAGAAGELLTGGDGLARGYFGRPDLTAERFIPDPFSAEPGARLYRTGDLARWLPDGTLEFLGRIDQQVKIRGFRIEPGEIETALGAHPQVRECVVVARAVGGDKQLVAYVVPTGEGEPGDWRAWLRDRLPAPMIPAAFVTLAALPLTPNGKIDRAALPAPEIHQGRGEPAALPRTPAEAVVAEVWSEVLDLEEVGVHDDFFMLGGHSLKATQLVSRLRQVFGVSVTLPVLLRQPTVAGVAAALLEDPVHGARAGRVAELLVGLEDDFEEGLVEDHGAAMESHNPVLLPR